jgi:hypothetical protein
MMHQGLRRDTVTVEYKNAPSFRQHAAQMQQAGWTIGPHTERGKRATVTWYRDAPWNISPNAFLPPPPSSGLPAWAIVLIVIGAVVVVGVFATTMDHSQKTGISGTSSASTNDVRVPLRAASAATADKERVTVVDFTDNPPATDTTGKPRDGYRYVVLTVVIENADSHERTPGQWKLHTADNFEYNDSITSRFGPTIPYISLTSGGKTQGTVVFEIPSGATIQWIKYDPSAATNQDLYFDAS